MNVLQRDVQSNRMCYKRNAESGSMLIIVEGIAIKRENSMPIQIAIIDYDGMANAHLNVCLNTEVYQKVINERWGVIVV